MAKASKAMGSQAKPRTQPGKLLKEKAYQRIKYRILIDKFGPETVLSERQVVRWLNMNKTPIKSAFDRLEHEGFITIYPQQGVVVRNLE